MSFDPQNPDFYGYLLPAISGQVVCVAAFVAVAADVLRISSRRRGPWLVWTLVAGFAVFSALQISRSAAEVSLREFRASRLVTDLAFGRPGPAPVLLAFHYQLFFALQAAVLVDGHRPDSVVVNPNFLTYPGCLASTLTRTPQLKEVAHAVLARGKLTEAAVTGLAWKGPLRLEPWIDLPEEVVRYMVPDGALYEATAEPMARADVTAAADAQVAAWERFYHVLGTGWQEAETRRFLIWQHYEDALFLARFGARSQALWFVRKAQALGAKEPILEALEEALAGEEEGPLEIEPFLVRVAAGKKP